MNPNNKYNNGNKSWCDLHKWGTYTNDECKNQLICALCKKSGHKTTECRTVMCHHCKRTNNPKGFYGHKNENCFLLQTCSRCDGKGHQQENCRTILCKHCKFALKNDRFLGHSEEECFLFHPCTKCHRLGHLEKKCFHHGDDQDDNNQKISDNEGKEKRTIVTIFNEDRFYISVLRKKKEKSECNENKKMIPIKKENCDNITIFVIRKKATTTRTTTSSSKQEKNNFFFDSSVVYQQQRLMECPSPSPSLLSSSGLSWADSMPNRHPRWIWRTNFKRSWTGFVC